MITVGIAFVVAVIVVVVVFSLARKRAPVEGRRSQASALESGFGDHVAVKEGGAGYWPPLPSAPPMEPSEELERGGPAPVGREVYGEIVEEDYDLRRRS